MIPKDSIEVGIAGERIALHELGVDDVGDAYHRWMNDPEVVRHLESRFEAHSMESLRQYVAAVRADPDSVLFGIVLRDRARHIGNIKLGPIARAHGTADIGLLIGDRNCWGSGYATEAISLVSRYAFETLGLRKVTASCYSTNEGSARAFEKAGFAREGLRRAQFVTDEGLANQIMLGLVRAEGRG